MKVHVGCGLAAALILFVTSFGRCSVRQDPGATGPTTGCCTAAPRARARFSPLARINAETVKDLGLAWSFATDTTRGLEATPIVADGVLYTTGAGASSSRIDARTGQAALEVGSRSAARGRREGVLRRRQSRRRRCIAAASTSARSTAGSRRSTPRAARCVWQTVTVDQTQNYTITGAPRIVKGKVIIGNGGGEYGVRGYVSAYDAETGKLAWRFYTVPGDPAKGFESPAMERAAKTWTGEWWKLGGGGTVWDSFVLRSRARSALRRHRQRLAVEPAAAQPGRRRQSLPLVDPRAAPRHRRAGVALPDDARRHVGLHRDAAHDPRRPDDRRARRARC